jgi:hypothetical protein
VLVAVVVVAQLVVQVRLLSAALVVRVLHHP